jgi:hypothetical protein
LVGRQALSDGQILAGGLLEQLKRLFLAASHSVARIRSLDSEREQSEATTESGPQHLCSSVVVFRMDTAERYWATGGRTDLRQVPRTMLPAAFLTGVNAFMACCSGST